MSDLESDLPTPEWLEAHYGLEWDGSHETYGGQMATVLSFDEKRSGEKLVMRVSDGSHIGLDRLLRVHRFLRHQSEQGVKIPLPLESIDGQTATMHEESGMIVEIMPWAFGRHPVRGRVEDARRAAVALARWHAASAEYADLPDEGSIDQNHVNIKALQADMALARKKVNGATIEHRFTEAVAGADAVISDLESIRSGLIDTCLHLDSSPGNIILSNNGDVWFLDCSHSVRGRRVFDVVATSYYFDPVSQHPAGDPRRYDLPDAELSHVFLSEYQTACDPEWTDEETAAVLFEQVLMLVHGATCAALYLDDNLAAQELDGFANLRGLLHS